jgi:hypothetical protein
LYNKIKHDIVLEEYLIQENNFKNRQLIAKFRTSDHCLQIETGRYNNIPRQQRLCATCNILEDEYHFFLNCHLNQQPRNLLINTIENKCPSFIGCLHLHKTITRLETIGSAPVKDFSYIYMYIMFVVVFFYMFACFCIVIACPYGCNMQFE